MQHGVDQDLDFWNVWSAVRARVKRELVTILVFAVLFYIASVLVLTPLRAAFLYTLIRSSGDSVISNTAIASFLSSAPGIGWALTAAVTGLVLLLAYQAGFVITADAASRDIEPRAGRVFGIAIRKMPRLLTIAVTQIGIAIAIAAPILGITAYAILDQLGDKDINFHLAERTPQLVTSIGLGVAAAIICLTIGVALASRWAVALPICLFEGRTWFAPLRESWRRTRSRVGMIVIFLGTLLAGFTLVSVLGISAFAAVGGWLIGALPHRLPVLLAASAGLLTMAHLLAAFLTFIGAVAYGFLVNEIYRRLALSRGETPGSSEIAASEMLGNMPVDSFRRWVVRAAVLVFLALSIGSAYALVEGLNVQDTVKITAHRGSSAVAPENSLSAIRQAIADGAHYAEIDVQETADGVVVLLHDTDLNRVARLNKSIWNVTYDEIKDLDAGSWFSEKFKGEPIPTLQQAIDLARGKIKLNIELKFNGHDVALAERTLELIEANDFADDCVVTSLDVPALNTVKSLNSDLKVGAIISASVGDVSRLDVDLVSLFSRNATNAVIAAAHRRDMDVHVWTVNRRSEMSTMIERGVDNIITDHPAELVELLNERAELTDVERLLLKFGHYVREN